MTDLATTIEMARKRAKLRRQRHPNYLPADAVAFRADTSYVRLEFVDMQSAVRELSATWCGFAFYDGTKLSESAQRGLRCLPASKHLDVSTVSPSTRSLLRLANDVLLWLLDNILALIMDAMRSGERVSPYFPFTPRCSIQIF